MSDDSMLLICGMLVIFLAIQTLGLYGIFRIIMRMSDASLLRCFVVGLLLTFVEGVAIIFSFLRFFGIFIWFLGGAWVLETAFDLRRRTAISIMALMLPLMIAAGFGSMVFLFSVRGEPEVTESDRLRAKIEERYAEQRRQQAAIYGEDPDDPDDDHEALAADTRMEILRAVCAELDGPYNLLVDLGEGGFTPDPHIYIWTHNGRVRSQLWLDDLITENPGKPIDAVARELRVEYSYVEAKLRATGYTGLSSEDVSSSYTRQQMADVSTRTREEIAAVEVFLTTVAPKLIPDAANLGRWRQAAANDLAPLSDDALYQAHAIVLGPDQLGPYRVQGDVAQWEQAINEAARGGSSAEYVEPWCSSARRVFQSPYGPITIEVRVMRSAMAALDEWMDEKTELPGLVNDQPEAARVMLGRMTVPLRRFVVGVSRPGEGVMLEMHGVLGQIRYRIEAPAQNQIQFTAQLYDLMNLQEARIRGMLANPPAAAPASPGQPAEAPAAPPAPAGALEDAA